MEQFISLVKPIVINLLIAGLIYIVGKKIMKVVLKILNSSFERTNTDISIRGFLYSLAKVVLYAVLIVMIAGAIGVDTTSFITVIGSAGIAIGLALKESLANFAGGIMLLFLKPFRVGDYIIACGMEGSVRSIDLFYTSLATLDNKTVTIPNGMLSNSTVINVSAEEIRRLDLSVGISYQSDLKKAKKILGDIMDKHGKFIKEKGIDIYVDSLADSAVILGFRGWLPASDYWSEKWAILEEVKLAFDQNGVEIPFNQLDIHLLEKGKL